DVDKMAAAAKGAGLVFYCNPNNPTATYVGAKATRAFLAKLHSTSPETTILVDEAYFDYVTDPDHETHIPIAVENPRVIVARTFSKAYGMAGLRQGYAIAHPDTIKKMREWCADRGMKPTDCQANFMFVDIGTPAKAFRDACRAKGVMVARDFPPFEKTHARI